MKGRGEGICFSSRTNIPETINLTFALSFHKIDRAELWLVTPLSLFKGVTNMIPYDRFLENICSDMTVTRSIHVQSSMLT